MRTFWRANTPLKLILRHPMQILPPSSQHRSHPPLDLVQLVVICKRSPNTGQQSVLDRIQAEHPSVAAISVVRIRVAAVGVPVHQTRATDSEY